MNAIRATLATLPLVDHHVHSILRAPVTDESVRDNLTEAAGAFCHDSAFDSQLGFAVRRFCAPVLGLEPFATGDAYLQRRGELGFSEASARLLRASGIDHYLIDGGHLPEELISDEELMDLAGARNHRIVRLETTAESVMAGAASGSDFLSALDDRLTDAARGAIGFKSVAAYRVGLDLDPARPTERDVQRAAQQWHSALSAGAPVRLVDPTVIRHLLWWALERGHVVQIHSGFGGPNLRLERSNPALLQPLLAASERTGGRIALLHCYPFVREAGFLAHIYPHVYLDVGLAVNYLGANAEVVVRESLDLAPFGKVLFSSDAWGLPELAFLGAELWRNALGTILTSYVQRDGWPESEAIRIAHLIARGNASTLYGIDFPIGRA